MRFNVGDRVIVVQNTASHSYSRGDVYTISLIQDARIYLGGDTYCYEQDIEFISNQFMRRVIEKGALVKVTSKPEVFFDLDEKAKELGATDRWSDKFTPKIGDSGEVIGIDDGYVLVDFDSVSTECLLDISCLESQKRKEEVNFLVRYPNGALEEYATEKEVEKHIQDLYKSQNIKPGEIIKVYNVEGYREVKIKIEVAFM